MLYPRIIPCLLVHNRGLVKTLKFKDPKYVGDPLNAVKIYNEKEVDELVVLDIDATVQKREPDYRLIKNIAVESRMPLCYGGGVKTVEQALQIFSLGVEKIAISSSAIENPVLISQIAERVGRQSVITVIDVKKKLLSSRYEVFTHNAVHGTGHSPAVLARKFQDLGAGEIVLNSIDNDGTMKGYDLKLINEIRDVIDIPMTVLGGAGTIDHIGNMISEQGVIGAAAGSLFVFKGKYRAVLINYPNRKEKEELLEKYYIKHEANNPGS